MVRFRQTSHTTQLLLLTLLVLFAASSFSTVAAAPRLEDVHRTHLEVMQLGDIAENGKFAVTVRRIDDLVTIEEGKNAKTVAERVTSIFLLFDVTPQGEVSVNGNPVPLGLSHLQVQADLVTGLSNDSLATIPADELQESFELGIVDIKVSVVGDTVNRDGRTITRLVLAEQLLEVNGKTVQQTDVIQQVFEVSEDGQVMRGMPCHASPEESNAAALLFSGDLDGSSSMETIEYSSGCMKHMAEAARWFSEQPLPAKLAMSIAAGSVFALLSIVSVKLFFILMLALSPEDDEDDEDDEETGEVNRDYAFLQKVPLADDKDDYLPVYQPNGYSLVSTDDKIVPDA